MPAGTELILLEVSELSLARLAGGVRSAIIGDSCGRGSTGREICYASNMQIFLVTDRQCVDTDTDTHTHIYSISAVPSWFSASCVIPVASKISSKLVKDWLCPPELRLETNMVLVSGVCRLPEPAVSPRWGVEEGEEREREGRWRGALPPPVAIHYNSLEIW